MSLGAIVLMTRPGATIMRVSVRHKMARRILRQSFPMLIDQSEMGRLRPIQVCAIIFVYIP